MSELEQLFQEQLRERRLPWTRFFWQYWQPRLQDLQLRLGQPLWDFIKSYPRLRRLWRTLNELRGT